MGSHEEENERREKEEKDDEKSKDGRSYEERIASLKQPDAVPQPDEEALHNTLAMLNDKIEKCDQRLTEIKNFSEKAVVSREENKSEAIRILDKLKSLRVTIKDSSQQRENLYQQLRDMKSLKEAQQKSLQDLRKSLKYDDEQQVDRRVHELERKISCGQCTDPKEEKRMLLEINQLNQMKSLIAQYNFQRQSVANDPEDRSELERRYSDACAKLDVAKKEAVELEKALEAARGSQNGRVTSTGHLWKEQKEIYGQIKAHRNEIRKVKAEFSEEMNKFRDFQRRMQAYRNQVQKIEFERRRAEWEARKKDAEKPIDADLPSDNPLIGHPWAEEIAKCSDLENVLIKYLPKEVKGDSKEEEKERSWLKGAAGKHSGKEDEHPFASLAVSKKRSAKKLPPAASARIVLTIDTISSLSAIGIAIPTTAGEVQGCLDQVKRKKEALTNMTENDKKQARAKQGIKGDARGEVNKSCHLVTVDISCAAPDRVHVSIEYPALSASA